MVLATTYIVLVLKSITGVPVTPTSVYPLTTPQPRAETGSEVTVVPFPEFRKLTCHKGVPAPGVSALKAYMLSCAVATYTAFTTPTLGMFTLETYKGSAIT